MCKSLNVTISSKVYVISGISIHMKVIVTLQHMLLSVLFNGYGNWNLIFPITLALPCHLEDYIFVKVNTHYCLVEWSYARYEACPHPFPASADVNVSTRSQFTRQHCVVPSKANLRLESGYHCTSIVIAAFSSP